MLFCCVRNKFAELFKMPHQPDSPIHVNKPQIGIQEVQTEPDRNTCSLKYSTEIDTFVVGLGSLEYNVNFLLHIVQDATM